MRECKTQDQSRRPTAGSPTAGRRPGPAVSGARRLKRTGTLLLGLALSTLSACTSFAANHITVTREVFLERGHEILPRALVRTHDGGYVIAGFSGTPWATRVNAAGQVQWRYRAPRVPLKAGQVPGDSTYTGAVILPDDSTLLCGYEPRPDQPYSVRALLTRISPHGRVLSVQMPDPNHDPGYVLSYLHHCVRWGKGVAVVGTTMRFRKHGPGTSYVWLLKLDDTGRITWQKLIPNIGDTQVLALPGRQLLLAWAHSYDKTDLVRLDAQGDVKARGSVPGAGVLVHPLATGPALSVVSAWSKPHLELQIANADLGEVTHRQGEALALVARRAYRLPNGALVLFGYTTPRRYGGMLLSSIAWVGPHVRHRQIFRFKPWSIWIADAVPTGKPGEFATIRQVGPMQRPGEAYDRNQLGVVLAFVHIQ